MEKYRLKSQDGGGGLVARSCPTLCNPMDYSRQAPLSMGFSRQEYWSGLLFPSPGDLPNTGIKPGSLALQADDLLMELWGKSIITHHKVPLRIHEIAKILKRRIKCWSVYVATKIIINCWCRYKMVGLPCKIVCQFKKWNWMYIYPWPCN